MRSTTTQALACFGIWLLATAAGAVCNHAAPVAQQLESLARSPLPPHVAKAVEALGAAPSLHLRARITVTSDSTANRPVAGVYEYWEKGDKYRMHFGIDAPEASVPDIAYDGHHYQIVLAKHSQLAIEPTDDRFVPSGIPNPLFLRLQPLDVATVDCPGCALRLSDLRALRDLRHAAALGVSSPAPQESLGSNAEITLTASGDPATAVWSREHDGVVRVERAEFSDYRAVEGQGFDMPRRIKFSRTVKTADSLYHLTIEYQIDDLEVGSDIDDAVFTLDRSGFESIWSGDLHQFIKSPSYPTCQD